MFLISSFCYFTHHLLYSLPYFGDVHLSIFFCSISDEFYSLLYLGLFCEACRNEPMKASMYMTQAIQTQYATGNGQRDYMVSVAKVNSYEYYQIIQKLQISISYQRRLIFPFFLFLLHIIWWFRFIVSYVVGYSSERGISQHFWNLEKQTKSRVINIFHNFPCLLRSFRTDHRFVSFCSLSRYISCNKCHYFIMILNMWYFTL